MEIIYISQLYVPRLYLDICFMEVALTKYNYNNYPLFELINLKKDILLDQNLNMNPIIVKD